MAPPNMAAPLRLPVGGNKFVDPKDMIAVRVKSPCTVNLEFQDKSTIKKEVTPGTIGYLIQNEGEMAFVQIINKTGHRALCRLPRAVLEMGKPHSAFKIVSPRLLAAQSTAPVATQRANHPAGKAILMFWEDVQKNGNVLKDFGFRMDVYQGILEDEAEKRKALNAILASFPDTVWQALNTPGLPVNSIVNLPKITQTWPRVKKNEALYLRLYTRGTQQDPQYQHFAKYGGRTAREYPNIRQQEHDDFIDNLERNDSHYREARRYPAAYRYAIPMMMVNVFRPEVISMAEMTVCCLFRTWHPRANSDSNNSVAEGLTSGALQHSMLWKMFSKITDDAFRRVNFPLFHGTGCNVNYPLQETLVQKREWLRYRVTTSENRTMLVYRWQSRVTTVSSSMSDKSASIGLRAYFVAKIRKTEATSFLDGFQLSHNLASLPGIKLGMPLIISVELMEDGKPHLEPWYRHPYHGAWDNSSELHSFAIRVEWADEEKGKWYSCSLQHTMISAPYPKADRTVTHVWRKATMILQFFRNRRYQNPPRHLLSSFQPHITEVVYDHLNQTVSFVEVAEVKLHPPRHYSFEENMRLMIKAAINWPKVLIGPQPPPGWAGGYKGHLACTLCALFRGMARTTMTVGCDKREPNFDISASELNQAMIRDGSCRLC